MATLYSAGVGSVSSFKFPVEDMKVNTRHVYDTPIIEHHITNLAVVRESTEGGDVLDREVSLRRSRADVALLSDPVDLLVELYQTTIMSHITYHITTSGISGEGGAGRGTYELGCCFVVSVLYHQRSSHAV